MKEEDGRKWKGWEILMLGLGVGCLMGGIILSGPVSKDCPECEPCPEVAAEWSVEEDSQCSEKLGDCLMNFTICQTIVEILQEQLGEEKVKYNKDTYYEVSNDPLFEHNKF